MNRTVLALIVLAAAFSTTVRSEDAGDEWVSAYAWIQVGDRLASGDQWPLAMASYIEARRQVALIAEEFPEFEPDLIAYRLDLLEETIETTREKLAPGDNEIMVKFLDFIDSFEVGQEQRFRDEYVDALNTLDFARRILDEIIDEKPDVFAEAVSTQSEILADSIAWLDAQVNFKARSRPAAYVSTGSVEGTTEFIREADLPKSVNGVEIRQSLFPEVTPEAEVIALEGDSPEKEAPAGETVRTTPKPFRMNTKSDSVE